MKNGKLGFTLIELLVAISIIATLTAILLPNFMGARERAKDTQRISDLNAVKNALRMYYNEHQSYPVGFSTCAGLSATLASYLPGMSGIGCTYTVDAAGETFDLCVGLDAGSGDEDIKSQIDCGANTGVCGLAAGTTDKLFVVCAK
ncbi:MAG: type II secretion system protein [Candidatus Shapirobacteria bacterium]|jgi:prepilin-type N-terminal cleavage/methylation domain-containing protein